MKKLEDGLSVAVKEEVIKEVTDCVVIYDSPDRFLREVSQSLLVI